MGDQRAPLRHCFYIEGQVKPGYNAPQCSGACAIYSMWRAQNKNVSILVQPIIEVIIISCPKSPLEKKKKMYWEVLYKNCEFSGHYDLSPGSFCQAGNQMLHAMLTYGMLGRESWGWGAEGRPVRKPCPAEYCWGSPWSVWLDRWPWMTGRGSCSRWAWCWSRAGPRLCASSLCPPSAGSDRRRPIWKETKK